MKYRPLHKLKVIGVVFVLPCILYGQTEYQERQDLVTELNTKLALIQTTSTSETVSLNGTELKGIDGTCTEYTSSDHLQLIADGNNVKILLQWEDDQRELDVPIESHPLVCDLNSWLGHAGLGGVRYDTANSRGFESACSVDVATQKYFMIDGEDYSGMAGGLLTPWGGFRDDRYGVIMNPNETEGAIRGQQLVRVSRRGIVWGSSSMPIEDVEIRTRPVWIGKRTEAVINEENVVLTEIRHAHNVLQFDYRYYDQSTNPNPYIDPDNQNEVYPPVLGLPKEYYVVADNDIAKADKLDSVVIEFRMNAYASPGCTEPQHPKPYPPSENKASITMTAYYRNNNVPDTWIRTWQWNEIGDPDANNDNLWNAYVQNNWSLFTGIANFDIDQDGDLLFKMKKDGDIEKIFYVVKLRSRKVPSEQCELVFPKNGSFRLDNMTGEVMYDLGSTSEKVLCLDFCNPLAGDLMVANVISASAQTFASSWTYDEAEHGTWREFTLDGPEGTANGNPYTGQPDNIYQRAEEGKWRLDRTFVYRSDIKRASDGGGTTYDNAGVFRNGADITTAFKLYNWRYEDAVDETRWLNASTVTQYAPSGEPVEEHDILGIYSTAKLAHDNTVALLVAKNVEYDAVGFNSFEEDAVNPLNSWGPTFLHAHAGRTSFGLPDDNSYKTMLTLSLTDQMIRDGVTEQHKAEQGLLVKFWAKRLYDNIESEPDPDAPVARVTIVGRVPDVNGNFVDHPVLDITGANVDEFKLAPDDDDSTYQPQRLYKVAQTGEWSLYQLIVDNLLLAEVGTTIEVRIGKNHSTDPVWVDDVRAQPLDALMVCYVYDRDNLRLLAQFDDQHFGVFYQYNGEGKLVRTRRETERGIKTITETQYGTPQVTRFGAESGGEITIPVPSISSARATGFSESLSPVDGGFTSDLLGIHIGPEGPSVRLLNTDETRFPDPDTWGLWERYSSALDLDRIEKLVSDIPEVERLQYMEELRSVEAERTQLASGYADSLSNERKDELAGQMEELEEKRVLILREKLRLSEEEIKLLYARKEESKEGPDDSETE